MILLVYGFKKLKEISYIGISDLVGAGISSIFWLYLANLLGPESFGEINYIISIANIGSTIALLGATQTLLVYSAKKIKIHATLYMLNLMIGIIIASVLTILINDNFVGLLLIGYMIFAIAYSDLLGKKYFKNYSILIIFQKILMVILVIGFNFIFGEEYIILGIGLSLLIGVFSIINGFKETKIDFQVLRNNLKFISFNYSNSIIGVIHGNIDKIIIAPVLGFVILGNYALAIQILSLLLVFPVIIGKYLIPLESLGDENLKLKKITIIISICLALIGSLSGPEILKVIFPKFLEIESIIRIICLAIIPSTIALTYNAKLMAHEKGKPIIIIGILRTGSFVLGIVTLGEYLHIEGIALSLIISESIGAIFSKILADRVKVEI